MKKILILTVGVFVINISAAQSALDQGAVALRGGINFLSTWNPGIDQATVNLVMSPGVSYNVIDQLALGAGVDLVYQSIPEKDGFPASSGVAFFFAPFARYTFSRDLPFFGELAYSVGVVDRNIDGVETEAVSSSNIRPAIGYSAFLNKNGSASLEPVFFYLHTRADGESVANNIGLGINFVWSFMNIGSDSYGR